MCVHFVFSNEPNLSQVDNFVLEVPAHLESRDDLLNEFERRLGFPKYFGHNWDALCDCLRDLSWVKERTVTLFHIDRPLDNDDEFRIYLNVLDQCIRDWEPDDKHNLVVVFPTNVETEIRTLLHDKT